MQVMRAYDMFSAFAGGNGYTSIPADGNVHPLPGGGAIRYGYSRPSRVFDAKSPRYGRQFTAADAQTRPR